jgi:hypothetical protein
MLRNYSHNHRTISAFAHPAERVGKWKLRCLFKGLWNK